MGEAKNIYFTCLKLVFKFKKTIKNGGKGSDHGAHAQVYDQPTFEQEADGRRRLASWTRHCAQNRDQRSAREDVQDNGGRDFRLRIPYPFRRQQNHRFRPYTTIWTALRNTSPSTDWR